LNRQVSVGWRGSAPAAVNRNMKTITHWIPAVFCAFVSLIALFASTHSPDSGWWRPVFFAFLPMCFFFVGSATFQMHRELRSLRQQLTQLEQQKAS
jgi:O-antigen/teichoic acid export membrane protein